MYTYVTKGEVKPYKSICRSMLQQMVNSLKKRYGITAQIQLIGSGANNLVTRNGNSSFDLDYNLILQSMPDEYMENTARLKDTVRTELDRHIVNGFSHGQDSTASVTYIYHKDGKDCFHFDLGIILCGTDGRSYRLINNKTQGAYIWNEVMDTRNIHRMAQAIYQRKDWNQLRAKYLELKNYHLRQQDSLPSYDIYAEAVNLTYNEVNKHVKSIRQQPHSAADGSSR